MNYDVVEVVIDRLISTFKLRDWQYDLEDYVEEIAEGLKLIGAAKIYAEKSVLLEFNGYVAKLPRDCQHLKGPSPSGPRYRESGNFVEMQVADGTKVLFNYQAMPVDTRGYPLVPDAVEVRQALVWWLARTLTLQGELTRISFSVADKEWDWRCGSARASLNVWSVADAAAAYNNFVRLNPLKMQHENDYIGVGKPNSTHRSRHLDDNNRYSGT